MDNNNVIIQKTNKKYVWKKYNAVDSGPYKKCVI